MAQNSLNARIVDAAGGYRAKVNANGDLVTSMTNPSALIAGIYAGVTSYGAIRTSTEPHAQFSDPFDGALDTVNRWTTGGTVAPTVTGGKTAIVPGAALSASTSLATQATFNPQGLSFTAYGWVAQFENISATAGTLFYLNSHRFMGIGNPPATWVSAYTASATTGPMLDAIGFEIDVDGKMYPVVYANGVRVRPALTLGGTDINTGNGTGTGATFGGLKALADGNFNQFGLAIRSDVMFWYCDSMDIPIAVFKYSTSTYQMPAVQTLPLRFHAINGTATAPSGTMAMSIAATAVADTGSNNFTVSDGLNPWRKAGVTDVTAITNSGRQGAREQWMGNALNTNPNAVQLPTYTFICKPTAAALTANTISYRASLHHLATAVKTVRIRRIKVSALMSALAEGSNIEIHRVTAAPTGTAVTGASSTGSLTPLDNRDPAAEVTALNSLTAATSVGLLHAWNIGNCATAAVHGGGGIVYDWQECGQLKAITLRAGVLEGIAIGIISNSTVTPTLTIEVIFTEE